MEVSPESKIIDVYTSDVEGPLLFVTAAVHGNEPSGIIALQKVFAILTAEKPKISGTIVGVIGNTEALKKKVRYIDEDLNRTWNRSYISSEEAETSEEREMLTIIETLKQFSNKPTTERYFLDCHTTSSKSLPYISVQDKGHNLAWAKQFPCHIIKGFSDMVSGTIDHYLSNSGLTGFVLEAGQHQDELSPVYHEAIIWLALQHACALSLENLSSFSKAVITLHDSMPPKKVFEISYRHVIENGDTFKMEPGYTNFQKIKKGELLALHNGKEIRSEWNDYIFMPLYQDQGNDGFFIVSEVL